MRKFTPIVLILALIACKKTESRIPNPESRAATDSATTTQPAKAEQPLPRMIIRNANLSMIVDDTASAIEKITAAAESAGGYVSDTKVWRDGEQLRGTVTARIPADRLTPSLAVIRKLAVRIQSETIGSQEVTQEYVDLDAQLRNLQAAETELRKLMTTIRQNSKKASEVLEMYQQLTTIQGQIEQTKGRMRYLSQMSAMAVVQADLVPNALAKPVVEPGWQPVVIMKDASRALVNALEAFAAVAIWIVIYLVPILVILGVIALVAYRGINAAWKTRRSPSL